MEINSDLRQAELILEALGWCSNEQQYDALLDMAKVLLAPYISRSLPRALWLKSSMPNLGEDSPLSEEAFDTKYDELLRIAAQGGCPEAQYRHACNLYDRGAIAEAVGFYFESAKSDYAPAQWSYGIDTLHGNGTDKNESVGLSFIRLAAEQRYQHAVEFLIDAYRHRKYGLYDEDELLKWQRILPHCKKTICKVCIPPTQSG